MKEVGRPADIGAPRSGSGLSAAFVKSVSEPEKYQHRRGMGLYLRVDPGGSRFWIQPVMIRGRRRELGLGSYPIVSLAEAREQALDNKRLIRAGRDPLWLRSTASGRS